MMDHYIPFLMCNYENYVFLYIINISIRFHLLLKIMVKYNYTFFNLLNVLH